VLDDVDVADEINCLRRFGCGRQRLEKMAPGVRETSGARATAGRRDLVVAGVHVDDERTLRAAEHLAGGLAAAAGAEAVGDDRRGLVAQEGPHEGALRGAQHLDRRLVGADDGRGPDQRQHARDQRREQLGGAVKEVGHRAAGDRDADPPEMLLEPVERDRVAALRDDEKSDEARAVLHTIPHAVRPRRSNDVLAARAGERLAHVDATAKVAGHVLPLDGLTHPPAEPGGFMCEPLKAAVIGAAHERPCEPPEGGGRYTRLS
jgi:hypothetical protein